ncbi:MAG: AAA family ATPase, partial [Terriglobus sp.]
SMQLEELGKRICILGPSNSGKSTLADAIARRRGLPIVHLDQLHHLPHTDWQTRPSHEFVALHDAAIAEECWVMDRNYSKLFPQRFARATGLILLDVSTVISVLRYVRRTLRPGSRVGGLDGGKDSLKLDLLHHIAVVTRSNRRRYAQLYAQAALPKVSLPSARSISKCYEAWGLELRGDVGGT